METWLPAPSFEALYEVSDLGRVRSIARGQILAQWPDNSGYPSVTVSKDGRKSNAKVHRWVAIAFHGDKRNALHREVAHLDGSRTNARADNLKWCSKVENHSHMRAHGTWRSCDNAAHRILNSHQVIEIRKRQGTAGQLAERYGVSRGAIYDIWKGRNWSELQSGV